MLIKKADDRSGDVAQLEELRRHAPGRSAQAELHAGRPDLEERAHQTAEEKLPDLEKILKVDQFQQRVMAESDRMFPLMMAKLIGQPTLRALARKLAALHVPSRVNWAARFGLDAESPDEETGDATAMTAPGTEQRAAEAPRESEARPRENSKLQCAECGVSVPHVVARFCWFNKPRFGGQVYCRDCQAGHPPRPKA